MKRVLKMGMLLLCAILVVLSISFPKATAAESSGNWSIVANLPHPVAGAATAQVNGSIYVIGGSSGDMSFNYVQKYNIETKTWETKANMPTPRAGSAFSVVDGKIYVFGGYTGNYYTVSKGIFSNAVEVYDPASDTWTKKSNMPVSLTGQTAASYNGKIYLFGGLSFTDRYISYNYVYEYDPVSDSWTPKKQMDRNVHVATAVTYNNNIYLVGGRAFSGGQIYTYETMREYNPVNDTWSNKASMSYTRGGPAVGVVNDQIYVMGGVSPTQETNTTEFYNPLLNKWESHSNLNEARSGTSAIVYKDQIFVIGGSASTTANKSIGSVESITIATPTPTATPTLSPEPTATPVPTTTPTPEQPAGDRAILVVTMNTGLEKEFDLSMTEVNAFIAWYENKQSGSGTVSYAIDKHDNNKGPFTNRKDYVIFDKILTFSVDEYSAE
ncbi:Kelch repeat-containing protein [Paenibacillus phytohabitans]|uniref:Kelch repeat-containing protein n=1 Tax=Paenibacillus phytohabitans TaxID=2654978 RepID=UPI00300BEC6E